jgi:predicted ATPase
MVAGMERFPVMALVTDRPEYQPHWQVRSASTQIVLRPLLDEQAAEIARARAGGPLPAELEKRIVSRAEGNPFFVEEITRALVEQGQIVKDDLGVHVTGPIEKIRIPGTVQELIEARLDRLSPRAKRLAQVAAVFGRQFRVDQVRRLLEPEGIEVGAGLEELLSRGLLHSASTERGEYRFGESLTQSVCYEGLLIRERRDLHERIAGMIEEDPRGVSAERAGLIAHHLARSENRDKAIGSLLAAARAAEELPSYPSSAALFRQAWQLAEQGLRERPDDPEGLRAVLESTLGIGRVTVLYVAGDGQTEERAGVRAREVAEQLGDMDSLTHALTLQGMIVIAGDGTRFGEGLELMERGFQIAKEHGLERALISSQRALGWTYLKDGQFAKSSEVLNEVTRALESLGEHEPPSDLYLSIQYFKSTAAYWQDDLEDAKRVALWTHEACLEKGNRTLRGAAAAVLAQTHFALGRYPEALEWANEALSMGKEIGNIGAIRTGAVVSLAAKLELGESVNPTRFLEMVVDKEMDVTGDSGASGNLIVELLVELGELDRASRYADAMALRSGGRLRQMQCLLAVAHSLRAQDDSHLDESEEEYKLALAVARELGAASFEVSAQIGLGSIAVERGELGAASQVLREAADLAESRGLTRLRDQALRVLAETTTLHLAEADTIPPRIN